MLCCSLSGGRPSAGISTLRRLIRKKNVLHAYADLVEIAPTGPHHDCNSAVQHLGCTRRKPVSNTAL